LLEERTIPGLHAALLLVVQSLGLPSSARIADLACGTGAWLSRLHNAGFQALWGIDQGEEFQAEDAAQFIRADLDRDSPLPARLALITMIEIIEHVQNPYRLLELAAEALQPGGWLLITSPNVYSLRVRLRFLMQARLPHFEQCSPAPINEDHLHPLLLEPYRRKIFAPLNLSVERVWTYPARWGHESRWFARLIAGVARLILRDDLPGFTLCLLLRKQGVKEQWNRKYT